MRGIGTPILGLALFAAAGLWMLIRWALGTAPQDASSITCRECGGEGAVGESVCVDCMGTGIDMPNDEWERRHSAWLNGLTDD